MKFTIADCVVRLNQILNYPSLEYEDVSHFFDQAISELNSELHIGLRPISEIYRESSFKLEDLGDFVVLDKDPLPNNAYLPIDDTTAQVYHSSEDNTIRYKRGSDTEYVKTKKLYGLYSNHIDGGIVNQFYQTVTAGNVSVWTAYEIVPNNEIDLTQYMPYDWVVLFLIPYVCFRYAVRDGDTGATYAEDFGNGFQQLRNSYNVPPTVNLAQQAGKKAYKKDVEEHLPNINIQIPTRAITEDMKVERNIRAEYGSMYDRGGWNF